MGEGRHSTADQAHLTGLQGLANLDADQRRGKQLRVGKYAGLDGQVIRLADDLQDFQERFGGDRDLRRWQALGAEQLEQMLLRAACNPGRAHADPLAIDQVVHRARIRQGMPLARNDAGFGVVEAFDVQVDVADVGRKRAHHEVESASANHLDQHPARATGDVQVHLGKAAGKTAEDRHQAPRQGFCGDTQCDLAFVQAIALSHILHRAIAIEDDRARPGQEHLAGRGQADALIGAYQQGGAQFSFQALNRLRQRALGNVQFPCRRTQAAHVDH
ncbi:hypothetical protein D3C84_669590 [compost metagenome]